jgi:lauroyl/myristoyl acyltransferase
VEKQSLKRRAFFYSVDSGMMAVFHVTKFFTRLLPPSVFYRMVDVLAALLYYLRPKVRRDLRRKISDAIPEITSRRRLDRIGRGAYEAMLLNVPDFLYFEKDADRFMEGLEVEGLENLQTAEAQGKGVVIQMTHMGRSPILHGMMHHLGLPFTLVMWHPETTPVPRYTMNMVIQGLKVGVDTDYLLIWVGPGHDTVGKVSTRLARSERVGVPFDVPGKRPVDFFGRPAALADGIAQFAYDSGAPIVPVIIARTSNPYRNRLIIHEPLEYELTGNRRTDTQTIHQEAARASERMIRLAPEQWMSWFGLWHWWSIAEEIKVGSRQKERP